MRVPYEWLNDFVDVRMKPEKLAGLLTMSGLEVESIERIGREAIFEINLTPNRADCLSIAGVAREVHAVSGAKLKSRKINHLKGAGTMADFVTVQVKDAKRCPRYSARVVRGVKIGPSPAWIVKRLAASGVRSINNVVDATNYVMFEMGQPLHAFDLTKIRDGKIIVRESMHKSSFVTLDGIEQNLISDDLLISDGKGPVALAGVMGGENSGVTDSTADLLLESAYFEPTGVRRTSKRLGLSSESSRRFERGIDPNGTLTALDRVTDIIIETAGGTPTSDFVDIYPKKISPRRIRLDEEDVFRLIGMHIKSAGMARILKALGFNSVKSAGGSIEALVPTFRPDIERPVDLIEEVARIKGYDKIPSTMPMIRMSPLVRPKFEKEETIVRDAMTMSGMSEAVLYGFTSAESLEPFAEMSAASVSVTNPLSLEQAVMRTALLPGLLDALKLNMNRQVKDCRLFALQRVFHRPMDIGPSEEPRHVAGIMAGRRYPDGWECSAEMLDFYDAKAVVESIISSLNIKMAAIFQRGEPNGFLHPGSFAYVIIAGKRMGFVGELHPDVAARRGIKESVFVFELDFEGLAELSKAEVSRFVEPSRFPFVERDISIIVEDRIPAVEVEKAIEDCGVALVSGVRIFDIYRGQGISAGKKSMALTVRFLRNNRTLTDLEVEAAYEKIVGMLKTKLGAELRM